MSRLRWFGIYSLCFLVVVTVRVGLWTTRYQTIRKRLVRPCAIDPQPERRTTVARICHATMSVARFIPDASCLTQTISCQAILSWKNIPTTITLGLQTDKGSSVNAHAWLNWNGIVILEGNEDTPQEYTSILDLPVPTSEASAS